MKTLLAIIINMVLITASATQGIASENHKRVKLDIQDRSLKEIAELGVSLEIAEYKQGLFLIGEFAESELELLKEAGFSWEVLISDMTAYYQQRNHGLDRDELNRQMRTLKVDRRYQTPQNFMLGSMGGFHTYAEMLDDLDAMHALFPNLISPKQSIGMNLTIQGRPVFWVRISNNPQVTQDKPRVLYTALTHAREPASMQQMLFQMWYLLENYDTDPEIQYLVDNTEMYFVPCVNPDGYIFCETTHPNGGSMHRKNMRVNADNSLGVDLNRNFGYMWGHDNSGSSPNPSSMTYRGTGPFSEPETQIQKQFAETFNFSLALNNHTYSDLLIYPWGYANLLTPDAEIFIEYAKVMTRENNYIYGTCYETLNYFANGGSDDWFYGEQTTKNKVFAFTPEAGKPSDGFWPAMNRIEEICAGHTHMNLSLARLALSYAEIVDLTGPYIGSRNSGFDFEIINLGQSAPSGFTVSLIPLTSNILSVGDPVVFEDMEVLQTQTSSIGIELKPYLNTGAEIRFVVSLHNGSFAWNDTITKFFGLPQLVFHDPCDNLNNWTTSSWGISNSIFYSAPSSIADSPLGNYANNANTQIVLNQSFDFSDVALVWAEFHTRFDIEKNWDYVQFMYSIDNKQTWIPLAGNYTETGGSNQDTGKPLYHGLQTQWVHETIDLANLAGQPEVWFRFRLISDGFINKEGFYFDDFKIFTLQYQTGFAFFPPQEIDFYQHLTKELDFSDFVSWETSAEAILTWENNNHINVSQNGILGLVFANQDPHWTGSETITLTLSDDDIVLSENIIVSAVAVPAPVVSGQTPIAIAPGSTLVFEPQMIQVEDAFFSFPSDFSIALATGENYDLQEPFTIEPLPGFTGSLNVPLTVHNGFVQSEVFAFQISVDPQLGIPGITPRKHSILWDQENKILSLNIDPAQASARVLISDISGRLVEWQNVSLLNGSAQIPVQLQQGLYIVNLSADISETIKIVVF